jgi:hypothetical protein
MNEGFKPLFCLQMRCKSIHHYILGVSVWSVRRVKVNVMVAYAEFYLKLSVTDDLGIVGFLCLQYYLN